MSMVMKIFKKYSNAGFPLAWIFLVITVLHSIPAFSENSVADEIISLNATDQPLGEVLKIISSAADCRFSSEPLHRGLKLIFRNINNAVIYGEDRAVKIIIYDRGPDSDSSDGQSITIKSPPQFIPQNQPFSEATAPQPEDETADDDSNPESLLEEDEAETEPDAVTGGADGENTPAAEETSDASGEKEEPTE